MNANDHTIPTIRILGNEKYSRTWHLRTAVRNYMRENEIIYVHQYLLFDFDNNAEYKEDVIVGNSSAELKIKVTFEI